MSEISELCYLHPKELGREVACGCHSVTKRSGWIGLARMKHYPGDDYMRCFINRCLEHGQQQFKLEELSHLLLVSRGPLPALTAVC